MSLVKNENYIASCTLIDRDFYGQCYLWISLDLVAFIGSSGLHTYQPSQFLGIIQGFRWQSRVNMGSLPNTLDNHTYQPSRFLGIIRGW